jgi:hypothetical protein
VRKDRQIRLAQMLIERPHQAGGKDIRRVLIDYQLWNLGLRYFVHLFTSFS